MNFGVFLPALVLIENTQSYVIMIKTTRSFMAILEITSRDQKAINGFADDLTNTIKPFYFAEKDKLKNPKIAKQEIDEVNLKLKGFAKIYNFIDLFKINAGEYYFVKTITYEKIDAIIFKELNVSIGLPDDDDETKEVKLEKFKHNLKENIDTICSINNKRWEQSSKEEKQKGANLYKEHVLEYVLKGVSFAYKNKFGSDSSLIRSTRQTKDEHGNTLNKTETSLKSESVKEIMNSYTYSVKGKIVTAFCKASDEKMHYTSNKDNLDVDLTIYPDGTIFVKRGKVKFADSGDVRIEGNTPTPAVIEQKPAPVAKAEAKPAAPAKPKPAPVAPPAAPEPDPEPDYEEVDELGIEEADDVEQDLINGVEDEK